MARVLVVYDSKTGHKENRAVNIMAQQLLGLQVTENSNSVENLEKELRGWL